MSPCYTSHLNAEEKKFFFNEQYPIMTQAYETFVLKSIKHEQEYMLYYHHIREHETAYFRLFENFEILVWAERTVRDFKLFMIIRTLKSKCISTLIVVCSPDT